MNNRRISQSSQLALIEDDESLPRSMFIQSRRYIPISISRSIVAGIIEPATKAALADEFNMNEPDESQLKDSVACCLCDCANNCFCYPICGCQTLYSEPHADTDFTLCPLTSITADASILCAGINQKNNQQNMVCNTICIPFTCVIDIVTLVPRAIVSICASVCNG